MNGLLLQRLFLDRGAMAPGTCLVGENGSGKSTLLKGIALSLTPGQRAESFCNAATRAEDFHARYGGRSLHRQSHVESFLHLIQEDFRPGGLYLPDEPVAAPSPWRPLTLLCELHRLSRAGAQFILATHSPIQTGLPGASLLSVDGGAMRPIAYGDTDSCRVTEMFINRRESLLSPLLED